MSDKPDDQSTDEIIGAGTMLRGNFQPRGSNNPDLAAAGSEKSDQLRRTEEFEKAARERIGGSIAFVTKLKGKDPLVWDGDEE